MKQRALQFVGPGNRVRVVHLESPKSDTFLLPDNIKFFSSPEMSEGSASMTFNDESEASESLSLEHHTGKPFSDLEAQPTTLVKKIGQQTRKTSMLSSRLKSTSNLIAILLFIVIVLAVCTVWLGVQVHELKAVHSV